MELSIAHPASLAIVPQPPPPGLYLTLGPENLTTWALESITRSFASPVHILWIDAANAFNSYLVAIAARMAGKDPTLVLRSFQIARPFTAYQLEAMIAEKVLPAARQHNALFTVIADPLRLFADAEGRDTQLRQCYVRFLDGLKALSSETAVLVLSQTQRSLYCASLYQIATRITHLSFADNRPVLSLLSKPQAFALS